MVLKTDIGDNLELFVRGRRKKGLRCLMIFGDM
jgi:hypothetical protein